MGIAMMPNGAAAMVPIASRAAERGSKIQIVRGHFVDIIGVTHGRRGLTGSPNFEAMLH